MNSLKKIIMIGPVINGGDDHLHLHHYNNMQEVCIWHTMIRDAFDKLVLCFLQIHVTCYHEPGMYLHLVTMIAEMRSQVIVWV